jgi:hypothetical protein
MEVAIFPYFLWLLICCNDQIILNGDENRVKLTVS